MTQHTIKLKINNAGGVTPDPDPATLHFKTGDTLSFTSDQGKPTVEFDAPHVLSGSTFKSGDQPLKFIRKGKFVFHCGIELSDGKIVGWPKDPKSGGMGET